MNSILNYRLALFLPFVSLLLGKNYAHSCVNFALAIAALITASFLHATAGIALFLLAVAHAFAVIHANKKQQTITTINFIARKLNEH